MITHEELLERFHYNPKTGIFTYKISSGNRKAGDIANAKSNNYIDIKINGYTYKAQRLAWLYVYKRFPKIGFEIDHVDHNGFNNELINLREVTHLENTRNSKMMRNNTSKNTGISFHKRDNKWQAFIGVNNKQLHLGSFNNKKDAITARKQAEVEYKFHKNHGI